ncbi:hypothetical protein HY572_04455 [Candidatus Micrarchaeota archaeon]|nr:hypothetical protein [Candidatus Micrarchaeota archaeon]
MREKPFRSPLPSRFRTISNQMLKEYALRLKDWDANRARKIVESRIRDVEQEYYVHLALKAIVANPETRLSIVRGENPLPIPTDTGKAESVKLSDVLHASALGAAFSHAVGDPEHMFFYSAASGLFLPARTLVRRRWHEKLGRQRYPLFYKAKNLVRHPRPDDGLLTQEQIRENMEHLHKESQKIEKNFQGLAITLRMLDALRELVSQPKRPRTEQDALRLWGDRMLSRATGGRVWHVLEKTLPATSRTQKAPATPEERHERLFSYFKQSTARLADEPPEPGKEDEWLELQNRLANDRREYEKYMEVHLDLDELEQIHNALEIGANALGDDRVRQLQERRKQLEKRYPNPGHTRRKLRQFENGRKVDVLKLQKD